MKSEERPMERPPPYKLKMKFFLEHCLARLRHNSELAQEPARKSAAAGRSKPRSWGGGGAKEEANNTTPLR